MIMVIHYNISFHALMKTLTDGNSSPDQDEPPVVEPEQTEVDTACGRRVKKRYKSSTWGAW